ncbi:hypothetical protein [Mucilaginibacter sp.]|uniref:hypothetical protein n=1 Tax=Mucilaginibacter sp. TaxID=1882438 RepID=UPI003D0AA734
MKPEFITYKKFNDIALANQLSELLEKHNVAFFVEEEALSFDPTFAYNDTRQYAVKISSNDFETVNELLLHEANEDITEADKDYYLFSFTDSELLDVITKADEWNAYDVQLARKLLAARGKTISDEELNAIEEKRIEELKEPEASQSTWIIIGYIFALGGGILGCFIGWHLWSYKKTLPNGERLFNYSEKDRNQGKIIFYLSLVCFALWLVYKFTPLFTGDN